MSRGIVKSQQEAFQGMRADYDAAKVSRFRRRRTGIAAMGSGADYHYRNESDFLRIMEYARDMDRNDPVVGQMVDRAVLNIVQGGLTPDPKTPDAGLNQAIKDRWYPWSTDATQCSLDGELVYRDIEKLMLRQTFVDGDTFALPLDRGCIQVVEAHRCRTPSSTKRNVVHGILLDENRRRQQYWFTKDDINPMSAVVKVSEIEPVDAFDSDGYRNVLHFRNPKRASQTRALSAFTPIFDLCGMHGDVQFATLLKQQIASCMVIIRQRSADFKAGKIDQYGNQTSETYDSMTRLVEELAPGAEIRGLPGEQITGFSPNIPNAEFFQHMRIILQLIGINLGMPLVLLLMDASDTNFSGWRGAMDQARMGFRDMQQHLIDHFEIPIYQWKLRQFARQDAAMRRAMQAMGPKFFAHEWNAPRWPYIQPLQDSQADANRQKELQASPRRIHSGFAQDWNDNIDETVEDNGYAIDKAITRAKALTKTHGVNVTWREVLFLTHVDMQKIALPTMRESGTLPASETETADGEPSKGDDKGAAGPGGKDPADPEDQPAKEPA